MLKYFKKEFDASIEALDKAGIPAEQITEKYFAVFADFKRRITEAHRDRTLSSIEVGSLTDYMRTVSEISAWTYSSDNKASDTGETNDVSSFFYYMWNAWNKKECEIAFKDASCGPTHLWSKWCSICDLYGVRGAVERFYADLSAQNQDLLKARACAVYDGRRKKI